MNAFLTNNLSFEHFLHSIYFFVFFELDTPNFAEAALSNNVLILERVPVDFFGLQNDPIFGLLFSNELRQINFETIFYFFSGFPRDSGIAAIMLSLFFNDNFLALIVLIMGPSANNDPVGAVDAQLPKLEDAYRE